MSDKADTNDPYAVPEDYKPYVPVAKRRAQLLSRLGNRNQPKKKLKTLQDEEPDEEETRKQIEDALEREREKARRERTLLQEAQEVKRQKELEGELLEPSTTDAVSRCQQDEGSEGGRGGSSFAG